MVLSLLAPVDGFQRPKVARGLMDEWRMTVRLVEVDEEGEKVWEERRWRGRERSTGDMCSVPEQDRI